MTSLEDFRKLKDEFFAQDGQSPLTPGQKKVFTGLNYFPPDPALSLEVNVEEFPDKQHIKMQTTTGDIQEYKRYGKFEFVVDGLPVELTIFQSEDGFFLPFVDSLASKETYPAGRYIDPEPLGANLFKVDFNLAYNPYCAYNDYWSCPLTPSKTTSKCPSAPVKSCSPINGNRLSWVWNMVLPHYSMLSLQVPALSEAMGSNHRNDRIESNEFLAGGEIYFFPFE